MLKLIFLTKYWQNIKDNTNPITVRQTDKQGKPDSSWKTVPISTNQLRLAWKFIKVFSFFFFCKENIADYECCSDNSHSEVKSETQRERERKRRREIDQQHCVYNWVLKVNRGLIQMNQNMMHAYSGSLGKRPTLCTSLYVCLTKNVCRWACPIHLSDLHFALSHISRVQARIPTTLTPASQLVPGMTDQWCLKPCQFTRPVTMVGVSAVDGEWRCCINVFNFYNLTNCKWEVNMQNQARCK